MTPNIILPLAVFLLTLGCKSNQISPQTRLSEVTESKSKSYPIDALPVHGIELRKANKHADFHATEKVFSKVDAPGYEYVSVFSSGKHRMSEIRHPKTPSGFQFDTGDTIYKSIARAAIHLGGADTCAFFFQGRYYSHVDGIKSSFRLLRMTTSTKLKIPEFYPLDAIAWSETEKFYLYAAFNTEIDGIEYSEPDKETGSTRTGKGTDFVTICVTQNEDFQLNDFAKTLGNHFELNVPEE